MPWSQELRNYVNTQLEGRKPRLGARWAALQEELSLCGEEEALLLSYLYVTLPSADLGDYSPRFFREAARPWPPAGSFPGAPPCRNPCSCGRCCAPG